MIKTFVCVDQIDGSEKHKKNIHKKYSKKTNLRVLTGASLRGKNSVEEDPIKTSGVGLF